MNESITNPTSTGVANEPLVVGIGTQPNLTGNLASANLAAVNNGVATKYWLELVAYPKGSAKSLWLFVGGSWKRYDDPSSSISDLVQSAFLGTGSNVRVWYNGNVIVGLVVEGN